VDVLLRAGALLRRRGVPFRIVVAGRHPSGTPDEAVLARDLDLADRVEFRSWFIPEEQVPAYLAAADVVAFPYRTIDQSAGAVWAVSYGRPLVASRVGGLVELVEAGGAGVLVPPEDPTALADALERLLGDAALRARLGAAGRRYAETALAWAPIARTTLDAYRRAGAVL
jgi:glycosyltransferase involved in cell wall biosynthesis